MREFLNEIVHCKKLELEDRKRKKPLDRLISSISGDKDSKSKDLEKAISRPQGGSLRLIAEMKRASPSKGILRKSFDPEEIARIYEANGAHAISVLTDKKFFQGDLEDLKVVSKVTSLPLLRKDFILDPYQIYEAKLYGAKAILLIVLALKKEDFKRLLTEAERSGLSALVEIHDEEDLGIALENDVKLLGINTRDLKTFKVDPKVPEKLCKKIPSGLTVVVESGIMTHQDVLRIGELPVDAILVGEAFMRAPDIAQKMKELMGRC